MGKRMDALTNIILTPFQQAASKQNEAAIASLDYQRMRELFEYIIAADANTQIGNTCKMTQHVYQDLTSLDIALKKRDVATIKRIFSVISASDPRNAAKRLGKLVEKISEHPAKTNLNLLSFLFKMMPKTDLCNFKTFERVSSQNKLEMVKLILPQYRPSIASKESDQVIMNKVVRNGHIKMAKFLEKKSIGNLNKAIISDIMLTDVNRSVEMLQFALTRTNHLGGSIVTNIDLHHIIYHSLKRNSPDVAKFACKVLVERNEKIEYGKYMLAVTEFKGNCRNSCVGFGYSLLQDYEEKFGRTRKWQDLADSLLMAEVEAGNYHAALRFLDDQFIDLSETMGLIMRIIINIENDDANKEKWLEVLQKTVFHSNFNAYDNGINVVSDLKYQTKCTEVAEIRDFYLKQSKLIDFDYFISHVKDRKLLCTKLKLMGKCIAISSAIAIIVAYVSNIALKRYGFNMLGA